MQISIMPLSRSGSVSKVSRWSTVPSSTLRRQVRQKPCWRLKSVSISLALPWGINISDLAGHIPPPAKIVVEALDPIDVDRDAVWKVVSDPDCYPEFIASLERWETVTEGPARKGARYTVH